MSADKSVMAAALANKAAAGIIIAVAVNVFAIPLLEPAQGEITTSRRPSFSWGGIQGSYQIIIDDNTEFSSPLVETTASRSYTPGEDMDFGTYYWKVWSPEGNKTSPVRSFTINSRVALSRAGGSVTNTGNTALKLGGVTGLAIVGVGESAQVGRENVTATQV
jgi:hypothetical protein